MTRLEALPRVEVGGLWCTVATIERVVGLVADRLAAADDGRKALSVLCVNAHVFNLAWEDEELRDRLNSADVLALDGMSMVWACRRAGADSVDRCNMTEALRAFLQSWEVPACRALVIGLDPDSAGRAAAAIDDLGGPVRVAAAIDGYRPLDDYREAIATTGADLVLVGCGTPRSEEVVADLAAVGGPAVVWHVGGGTLHFLAGNDREAPAWMRRTGTQWVHRLVTRPRAMGRRYLVGNPRFVRRVLRGRPPGP